MSKKGLALRAVAALGLAAAGLGASVLVTGASATTAAITLTSPTISTPVTTIGATVTVPPVTVAPPITVPTAPVTTVAQPITVPTPPVTSVTSPITVPTPAATTPPKTVSDRAPTVTVPKPAVAAPSAPSTPGTGKASVGAPAVAGSAVRSSPSSPASGTGHAPALTPSDKSPAASVNSTASAGSSRSRPSARPRAQTVHRPGRELATRLTFRMPHAQQLRLAVYGPLGACDAAKAVRLRAHGGVNHILFAGRIRGRRLRPGIYVLQIRDLRGRALGGVATRVRVLKRGARPVGTQPATLNPCAPSDASQSFAPLPSSGAPAAPLDRGLPPTASSTGQHTATASSVPPQAGKTLGDRATRIFRDAISADGASLTETAFALAMIMALVLSMAAMFVLVIRYVRGSWNP